MKELIKKYVLVLVCICMVFLLFHTCEAKAEEKGFATAVPIPLNTSIEDSLTSADDSNYYRVELADGVIVSLAGGRVIYGDGEGDWKFELYNSDGKLLLSTRLSESVAYAYSKTLEVRSGTYYVKVTSDGSFSSSKYNLYLQCLESCMGQEGNFEVEMNDTFELATDLLFTDDWKADISGFLSDASDVDCFRFGCEKTSMMGIKFSPSNNGGIDGDWKVALYTKDNQLIMEMNVASVAGRVDREIGLPKGEYYVVISVGNAYTDKNYGLWVYNDYENDNNHEEEINNDFSDATFIKVDKNCGDNSYHWDGNLSMESDVDYYTFNIESQGYINYSFWGGFEACDVIVTLYDAKKKLLYRKTIDGAIYNEAVNSCDIGVSKGVYYLKIEKVNDFVPISYRFDMEHTPDSSWETEINNSFSSADKMSVNKTLNGCIAQNDDVDYYVINIPKKGYYAIKMFENTNTVFDGKWCITLRNAKKQRIKTYHVYGDQGLIQKGITLNKGKYYIKVEADDVSEKTNAKYDISICNSSKAPVIKNVTSPTKKCLTVKFGKVDKVSGYEISISTDKTFKKNVKTVHIGKNKTTYTFKKLKSKKTYYVRVRGYITKKNVKYYGDYSKVKKIKVW